MGSFKDRRKTMWKSNFDGQEIAEVYSELTGQKFVPKCVHDMIAHDQCIECGRIMESEKEGEDNAINN